MNLLLDTHIALWAVSDDPKLSRKARDEILAAQTVMVSVVTLWEIAIKHALRRGRHDDIVVSATEAHELFAAAGFTMLPVQPLHATELDALPQLHGDPFDRLLVAQALAEPIHLLTRDAALGGYGPLIRPI
ncbi:type II toxin-antitoxin system VapC family toxin [Sphingomonas sp.]|jgi:PIN domain nuclease of toxin-antitoxin system|uniref:type II toxin-antitoxin system VapC family toxin n=1 Tax=Sphingomonas sp. TaxID=28214 RepID=UPI0035C7C399